MKNTIFFLLALSVISALPPPLQAAERIAIGQIQASGQTADDEFVAITNATDAAAEIGTWSIQYKSASGTTFYKKNFAKGTSIAAGKTFIVCGKDYAGACDMKHSSFSLSSSGGTVFLVSNQTLLTSTDGAVIVDQKTYTEETIQPSTENPNSKNQIPNTNSSDNNQSADSITTPTKEFTLPFPYPFSPIISINELMPEPDGGGEWIELFNPTGYAVDLNGWTIADGTGRSFVTLDGLILPQGFKLVELAAAHLNNDGDLIILRDADKKEVDAVAYGIWDDGIGNAPLGEPGVALARIGDGRDTNDNKSDFALSSTTTPGLPNVITALDGSKIQIPPRLRSGQAKTKIQTGSGSKTPDSMTDIEKLIELLQGKDKIIIIENLTINTGTEPKLAAAALAPTAAPAENATTIKTTTKKTVAKPVDTAEGTVIVPTGFVGKDICVVREENRSIELRLPKDLKTIPTAGDIVKASGSWSTAKTLTLPRLLVKSATSFAITDHADPLPPTPIAMSEMDSHIGELVSVEAPIVEKQPTRFRLAEGNQALLIKSPLDALRGDKVKASGLLVKSGADFLLTPLAASDIEVVRPLAPPTPSLARKALPYGIAFVPAGLLAGAAYVGKRMKKKKGGESQ
jgi:hypothetical protein